MEELMNVLNYLYGLINGTYTTKAVFIVLIFTALLGAWHVYTKYENNPEITIWKVAVKTALVHILGLVLYIAIFMCVISWLAKLPLLTLTGSPVRGVGEAALLSYMVVILLIPLSYWIRKALTGIKKVVLIGLQCLLSVMFTIILISSFINQAPFNGGLLVINALINVAVSLLLVTSYARWMNRRVAHATPPESKIRGARQSQQDTTTGSPNTVTRAKRQRQRRDFK